MDTKLDESLELEDTQVESRKILKKHLPTSAPQNLSVKTKKRKKNGKKKKVFPRSVPSKERKARRKIARGQGLRNGYQNVTVTDDSKSEEDPEPDNSKQKNKETKKARRKIARGQGLRNGYQNVTVTDDSKSEEDPEPDNSKQSNGCWS
ncbi:unnamed protein product [Caenorhabditis angaria]|uniref:Uncharacterized protein n=1 Tax=Caenorhabditis angaria TaxID=860376 RepID=A0A9P1IFQ0_9PELO|nr:unnamed protein product [Caenorhabditis angaria]